MRNRRIAIINSFLKRRATMRKFLINNRGVATIEFVLTIFWYFFIVVYLFVVKGFFCLFNSFRSHSNI